MRVCNKCKCEKTLDISNFFFRKDTRKWGTICKECISIKNKNKYIQNSEQIKKVTAIYRENNRCVINEKAKVYNNKDETKEKTKHWRAKNKVNLRLKEKEWQLKNPEKYKNIVLRKSKKQRQKPTSKIKAHVSRQINFALHRLGNSKKGNSVLKFLPYNIIKLKQHLENLFESWMTWDNYGKYHAKNWNDNDSSTWTWQIDHIIPQSELLYLNMEDENFKKYWALENLRPLSSKQNAIDGSTKVRHK